MKIDLSKRENNEVFQVEGDCRFFKKVGCGKVGCGYKLFPDFYIYAYNPNAKIWRLDYSQARLLADRLDIKIVKSKIIHIVDDLMFLNQYVRNELKNKYSIPFAQRGKRYIAEATIELVYNTEGKNEHHFLTRTSSAGIDNIHPDLSSYAPEMACKRAVIKCIIDGLELEDIVEEYYGFKEVEEIEKEGQPKEIKTPAGEKTKNKITKITELQLEQLKILDPKFTKSKYSKKTEEQAGKIILKLKLKPIKKAGKKRAKKK